MDTTRPSSTTYGSNSRQSTAIPRSVYTRNQRPGLPPFGLLPLAQVDGSQVRNLLHRGSQPAALPHRHLRVDPGRNPYGNKTPGIPSPRHETRQWHQNRIAYSPHLLPRQQEHAGQQQEDLHSKAFHQWPMPGPSWPAPSTTGDFGLVDFPQWQNHHGVAPPQGSYYINEVPPTVTGGATVVVPETTPQEDTQGAQPAGMAPTQSTTGTCPYPACTLTLSCGRHQELERHVLKHLPPHICCPHPCCRWRGSRRYALMDHWKKKHPHDEVPDPRSPDAFIIYDAKRLAKRLVSREITLAQAVDEADASVRNKAVELGKWVMWNVRYE